MGKHQRQSGRTLSELSFLEEKERTTMGSGPSDKDIVKFLRENGEDKGQITDGKHQANDDMQSEGWLPERAVTKYLEKWGTEEQQKEWDNRNR